MAKVELRRLHRRGFFHLKNRRLPDRSAQGGNGTLDKLATPGILFGDWPVRVAKRMMKPPPTHNAIGPNPCCHRIEARCQHGRQSHLFTFFGNPAIPAARIKVLYNPISSLFRQPRQPPIPGFRDPFVRLSRSEPRLHAATCPDTGALSLPYPWGRLASSMHVARENHEHLGGIQRQDWGRLL
jgi:hypothetical protein